MRRDFGELIGESPTVAGLRARLEHLVLRYGGARRLPPMLLLGETGTGKSLIARLLHANGPRAGRPFVDVNCAAIPETLMEAEMFGFERGAFTDARQAKPGLFVTADRGTIFLDEVGLLPDSLQAKLLKVVDEQQVRPLGGTASRPIDVWIIAATSEDLEAAVRKRRFREDLYHRLAVVTLTVPPLRDRGEDIVLLATHLLRRACADYSLPTKTFTPQALAALRGHRWPGNIRELGNVIERVALLAESPSVPADALGLAPASARVVAAPSDGAPAGPRPEIENAVDGVELAYLLKALGAVGGNVTHAARHLGLTRNALRYRLRKHGIQAMAHSVAGSVVETPATAAPASTDRPFAPARWERRRVAFVRASLLPARDGTDHAQRVALQEAMQKIVLFGGTLDGVSPTGVTAVFGLDLAEDAARRAAHAAMAIRKAAVRARDVDSMAPGLRLAIHAVHALLWKVGDALHVDMDARPEIWRTLDTLLAAADEGGIVVSPPTATMLDGAFSVVELDASEGRAYVLVDGDRTVVSRTRKTVFVGRRDEIALLNGRLELALEGRGQVVGIGGEPGIGKSRALIEFHRTLDPATVAYLSTRCVSHGRHLPLHPIIELVRRAHGIDDDDTVDEIRGKLAAKLSALGLPLDEMAPYLMRLLGLGEGLDAIIHLSPEALNQRTFEIVQALVLASSRTRPLVLAVEDLHWIDRASERYMAALVDAVADAPVLVLTTNRTGHRVPWSDRSYVTELRLQPLGRADARRVLDDALDRGHGAHHLPAATAEAIVDRADGNPFFIEELARAIVAVPDAGPQPPVPESIEAVLLARIDRLAEECKGVLQAASVIGRDVPVRLLEAITPEIAGCKEHLRELQRLEYLHERSDGSLTHYRFKHALTQEVAYASLLPEHRRALHARTVDVIETQYADRLGEHSEHLARHAVHGELWAKAFRYLRHAGLRAAERAAHHEGVACLEPALDVLEHLPEDYAATEAIDIRIDLFLALNPIAEYHRCLDHLADAATLAERLGERARLGRALAHRCMLLRVTGSTDEAIAVGSQALAIATEIGDASLAGITNFFLAAAYQARGDLRRAAAGCRASFGALAEDLTRERARAHPRYEVSSRGWLAWVLADLGEFDDALAAGRDALRLAEARGDRLAEVWGFCLLAVAHVERGDWSRGIPLLERALAICRFHGILDFLARVTMHLGDAYAQTGRLAEGIALLEEGAAHAAATRSFTAYAARLAKLAEAYLLEGRRADAEATARHGLASAREHCQPAGEATCVRVLGMIAAAADPADVATAEAHLRQARELAFALEMRPLAAHCHLDLGKLYQRAGRDEAATACLKTAAAMYREMDMASWLAKADAAAASSGVVP